MAPKEAGELTVALITAVGAFIVACVAGAFSLLGLVISKEQQVSEFRQAWIDALRADLAGFVAHAHQIQALLVGHADLGFQEFWTATRDDYIALNQASVRIKLRLNPEEDAHKAILSTMGKMEALFDHLSDPESSKKLKEISDSLEGDAPALLKNEWVRVKQGEPTYRVAKWLAGVVLIVAVVAVVLLLQKI